MLRFKLKQLIADKEFRDRRLITLVEVSRITGVHRQTLTRLSSPQGYNPTADVLDRLCNYFGCRIEELVEHIPDAPSAQGQPTP
jgi:putative transcriptional regulator